jgi:hypothetical protein
MVNRADRRTNFNTSHTLKGLIEKIVNSPLPLGNLGGGACPHFSRTCRVCEANGRENGGLRTESNLWRRLTVFWSGSRKAP